MLGMRLLYKIQSCSLRREATACVRYDPANRQWYACWDEQDLSDLCGGRKWAATNWEATRLLLDALRAADGLAIIEPVKVRTLPQPGTAWCDGDLLGRTG